MQPESSHQAQNTVPNALTLQLRILSHLIYNFLSYFTIGAAMAVVPMYVHNQLAYSSVIAGLTISMQYVATLISRPFAGKLADNGPKRSVKLGLLLSTIGSVFMLLSALSTKLAFLSLLLLIVSRLLLGCSESFVSTGVVMWATGKVGMSYTAKVISWSGVTTYTGLALGAPLGAVIYKHVGFFPVAIMTGLLSLLGLYLTRRSTEVSITAGKRLPFSSVLKSVANYGLTLALGSIGFGVIATFITLYYASYDWNNAALALTGFSLAFVFSRIFFSGFIDRVGGYKVAFVSFFVEALGLLTLWLAYDPLYAFIGATLTGAGFSLIFPALGVEAVGLVPATNRGSALGAYTVFLDVALALVGPVAGLLIDNFGYSSVYLFGAIAAIAAIAMTRFLQRRAQLHWG